MFNYCNFSTEHKHHHFTITEEEMILLANVMLFPDPA